MNTKDVILELRTKKGLSQDELAEKVYVTRQAVSRWETGETVPNTETLKLLSRFFDVSINTLLGAQKSRSFTADLGGGLQRRLLPRPGFHPVFFWHLPQHEIICSACC